MALTTTTLNGAITAEAQSMVVTSATGFVAGNYAKIDQEIIRIGKSYVSGTTIPVSGRGLSGTVAAAHQTTANVTTGSGQDFGTSNGPQVVPSYPIAARARELRSYTAAGAIALPTPGNDMVAVINGTATIALTVAAPTKDQDGDLLYIIGNGKSASTVDVTNGIGNAGASYNLLTAQTAGQVGVTLMACNGQWVLVGGPPLTGTTTALTWAIA